MKAGKRRRTKGLIVVVVVFLLGVNITLGILMTTRSSRALISQIQGRMLDVSNTAAAMLDGDSLAVLSAADNEMDAYQKILDTLTYFQENIALEYIYCIRDLGNGQFVFTVDPTVEDPGEFGTPVVYTDALYRASQGTPAVDDVPYTDDWGTFYSAYSPVFTTAGEVGGIVCVDFSAKWYDEQVRGLIFAVLACSVLSLLVGILIVMTVTRRNRRRYRVLYGQLNELAVKVEELVHETEITGYAPMPEKPQPRKAAREAPVGEDIDALGAKILSMQEQIRRHIRHVQEQAYVDGMTGVGNKTAYLDTVRRLEKRIQSKTADFTLALFDLNGLKAINDNFGHECGDMALTEAAEILTDIFGRKNLYRIGGDEFIAILSRVDLQKTLSLFEKLDAELAMSNLKKRPYTMPLMLSKGASAYDPSTDVSFKTIYKRADDAMYENKRAYYLRHGDRRRRQD